MALFVNPFDRLLNDISHELDEQNLKSLIHVCDHHVSAREREHIRDGHDLFRVLRQRGVLSEDRENIGNLLEIIKAMRPKRQDLVNQVTSFIRRTVEAPDTILVIGSDSWEENHCSEQCPLRIARESRASTPQLVASDWRLCSMNCCCWSCNCYSRRCPPRVCVVMAVFFLVMAVVAAIMWYADVPQITRILKKDDDRRNSGIYAVGLLGFLGVLFLVVAGLKCMFDGKSKDLSAFTPAPIQRNSVGHYSSQNSLDTGSSRSLPRHAAKKCRRHGSKASSWASNSTVSTKGSTCILPREVTCDGTVGGEISADSSDGEVGGFHVSPRP